MQSPSAAGRTVRIAPFADLSGATVHDIAKLRVDVFVVEQDCAYAELDGRDTEPATRHLWVERDGDVLAYLRVLDDGPCLRVGRVVTRRDSRGRGLAAGLIEAALDHCGTRRPVELSAQAHLERWYARWGFVASGAPYDEVGILHVPMRRPPATTSVGSAGPASEASHPGGGR